MENYLNELKTRYYNKFKEKTPALPMMMAEDSDWFIALLELSIATNEPIKQEDVNAYIEKNNIPYDVIDEKNEDEEDGNKD